MMSFFHILPFFRILEIFLHNFCQPDRLVRYGKIASSISHCLSKPFFLRQKACFRTFRNISPAGVIEDTLYLTSANITSFFPEPLLSFLHGTPPLRYCYGAAGRSRTAVPSAIHHNRGRSQPVSYRRFTALNIPQASGHFVSACKTESKIFAIFREILPAEG